MAKNKSHREADQSQDTTQTNMFLVDPEETPVPKSPKLSDEEVAKHLGIQLVTEVAVDSDKDTVEQSVLAAAIQPDLMMDTVTEDHSSAVDYRNISKEYNP